MLSVEVPEPGTDVGWNAPLTPAGSPLTLKVTVSENPPDGVMVTV